MNHFSEVASDRIRHIAEDGAGRRIDLDDPEIRIDHINAHGRGIEQRLELGGTSAQRGLGAPAQRLGDQRIEAARAAIDCQVVNGRV